MNAVVTTIITKDYGHYALALHDSIVRFVPEISFCVFVTNGVLPKTVESAFRTRTKIILYGVDDFSDKVSLELKDKYAAVYHDAYRWGMKPMLLNKLLMSGYNKAIYVDSDVYFFNDFNFLLDELQTYNLLLSPHWRCSNPIQDLSNFKLNFLDGIYNGGFIGASQGAEEALLYWAELCLFKCEVNRNDGFYVDQRYLDILPTRFEGVGHITHRGCNVANWNIVDCQRVAQADGTVLINNTFPIVFIHFTNSLFKGAYLWKDDALLIPYIERYRDNLLNYSKVDVIAAFFNKGIHQQSRTESDFEKKSLIVKLKTLLKRTVKKVLKTFKLF